MGGGLLVAVRALCFWHRAVFSVLAFHRVSGRPPCRETATQRPGLAPLLSKELRHTGAGTFLWSSAIGNDLPIRWQSAEVLKDLGGRSRRLKAANNRLGRDPD